MNYTELSLKNYLEKVSEKKSIPGGGSVAGFYAASACALMEMSLKYSKGIPSKDIKFFRSLRRSFMDIVNKDAKVYESFCVKNRKYGIKSNQAQSALKQATNIPFYICANCHKAIKMCLKHANKVNKNIISDMFCSAYGFDAGFYSAQENIKINLGIITDIKFKTSIQSRNSELVKLFKKDKNSLMKFHKK